METELAYYGARYYQNKFSVWLSVDPLANENHNRVLSPYSYTDNNPVSLIDPDGRNATNPFSILANALYSAYVGRHPGVTTVFFEARASAGVGVLGGHAITQSGVARDEVGKTHFTNRTTIWFNTLKGKDANFALGAMATSMGGVSQDFDTETYLGQQYESAATFTAGGAAGLGLSLGAGERGISIALAIGIGAEIAMYEAETLESISLTYNEADEVNSQATSGNTSWGVTNIVPEVEGLVSGYVTIGVGKDKVTTDTKVFSKDGKTWMSIAYEIQAREVEGL